MVKSVSAQRAWLLFLPQLPAKPDYARVKLWRRMQPLGALALLTLVPVTLPVPVLREMVLERFSVSELATSTFMSINMIGAIIAAPLAGALSDRFGRRPILILSATGLGLDYILMALAPNLTWLFVGRVLSGITAASYPTAGAYVVDVTPPERRAAAFGMIGAAWGIGFILGPALGGVLGGFGVRLPFWAAAGMSLASAVLGQEINRFCNVGNAVVVAPHAETSFSTPAKRIRSRRISAAGLQPDGRLLTLNSYENRVYQVGLDDGTMVVAKFYRPGRWSDAQIDEELAIVVGDQLLQVLAAHVFLGHAGDLVGARVGEEHAPVGVERHDHRAAPAHGAPMAILEPHALARRGLVVAAVRKRDDRKNLRIDLIEIGI